MLANRRIMIVGEDLVITIWPQYGIYSFKRGVTMRISCS